MKKMPKKVIILLSGGLDSTTCLAIAKKEGYECIALSFDYGQRHSSELQAAKRIAHFFDIKHHCVLPLPLHQLGGSALTDIQRTIAEYSPDSAFPNTYVPARNTIFLSFALALAETHRATNIFMGVSAVDYSGYPDCRPAFIEAFEKMANLATATTLHDTTKFKIHTPLIHLSKAEAIQLGTRLGVDYALTVSCYQATSEGYACGRCDSCYFRKKGFTEAGIPDPTLYFPSSHY